jgi:hypothetical protein
MTQNVFVISQEAFGIVSGALVLILFAVTFGLSHRPRVLPGSSGHRESKEGPETAEHEVIRPDGYIDTFAHTIEEAGGSLPPIVLVAIPGILLWWLVYLILFWQPS